MKNFLIVIGSISVIGVLSYFIYKANHKPKQYIIKEK